MKTNSQKSTENNLTDPQENLKSINYSEKSTNNPATNTSSKLLNNSQANQEAEKDCTPDCSGKDCRIDRCGGNC